MTIDRAPDAWGRGNMETNMTYKPDIMIYHANCADGFGAAWAAWMRWRDEVQYIPVGYGQSPPEVAGKHVLIGDFSFKAATIVEMAKSAESIVILDHHKTAEADLQLWSYERPEKPLAAGEIDGLLCKLSDLLMPPVIASFDMARSGARMVWEFCHDAEVPWLIKYIEDRDLWRFQYEETKAFGLWLRSEPFDFERWELISQDLMGGYDTQEVMVEAKAMQRLFDRQVDEIAALARTGSVGGFTVPLCNCPPQFASEVGHKLLVDNPDAPFVACYSDQGKARGYSLRSQDHRQDVSEVARKFGGGGHRNAAGFGAPLP